MLNQLTMAQLGPTNVRIAGTESRSHNSEGIVVDIQISEMALRSIEAHTLVERDNETAGFLIGFPPLLRSESGRYHVYIHDAIRGCFLKKGRDFVTLTHETWRHINDEMDIRYPNQRSIIVGWYHSHPGFGVFFSEDDVCVHTTCFRQPWHVALVTDPRKKLQTGRFYGWNGRATKIVDSGFNWPEWLD